MPGCDDNAAPASSPRPGTTFKAPAGKPVSLTVVSNGTTGCTRGFVIPSIGYQRTLPETGQTTINIPASAANGNLRYTCSMGMYSGYFEFT